MKTLLVHSDNTVLLEVSRFEKNEKYFSIPVNKGVDEYISEFISERIVPAEADAIFIKYALTDNYLGFLGLRLAYHLRFEWENGIAGIPIVFVGEETPFELMKLSDYSDILATPGVYHINESLSEAEVLLDKIERNELRGLMDYKQFLEKIDVKPPSNYDTRHSIANELSLYLWSKYIGCEDQLGQVQDQIQYRLYFKYVTIARNYGKVENKVDSLPRFNFQAKVMLIDDEANKGWEMFYDHFFSNSGGIKFISNNIDSRKGRDSIIESCVNIVKEADPDILLLDLRLNERDTDESIPENLTGYKILNEVKKINKGIQVIITTASNKAPMFQELIEGGADGYTIKNNNPVESIGSLIKDIKKAFKEVKALKGYFSKFPEPYNKIENGGLEKINTFRVSDDEQFQNFCHDIIYYFDMASETFLNTKVEERFSYGVLQLYKILESFVDYYINESYDRETGHSEYDFVGEGEIRDFDFRNNYKPVRVRSNLNTSKLIYNVYYNQTGEVKQDLFYDIHQLIQYRNSYAHHTDPGKFDQLEDRYFSDVRSDFDRFVDDFKRYYLAVFTFISDISY